MINFILVALIAAVVVLCIRSLMKGKGSGGCSGDCSGCGSSCSSSKVDRNTIEEVRREMKRLSCEVVAVSCGDGVCVGFEQTDYFSLSFLKDGTVLETLITSSGLGGTAEKIDLLRKCRAGKVICKGIGAGALHRLENAGIPCVIVQETQREAALQAGLST